jgi:catechol 2,3-dioxygenase-like lactoylglutathione lyase family enzyme
MSTPSARACMLLAACLLNLPAAAEPVPADERIPVDLRRTTLLVRDLDRSLALYRDVLGLRVRLDTAPGAEPGKTRLVILCANDTFMGCVGLLRRADLPADAPVERRKPRYGDVYLVFNLKDLEQRFERARAVPGVTVESEPDFSKLTPPPGPGQMAVVGSNIWDPDGYFVELNLMVQGPAG